MKKKGTYAQYGSVGGNIFLGIKMINLKNSVVPIFIFIIDSLKNYKNFTAAVHCQGFILYAKNNTIKYAYQQ